MKNNNYNVRGFTLVEVVVSVAIFTIMVMALFNLFNVVYRNIKNNKAILLANGIAQEKLEIVRGMSFDDIKTDTGWLPAGPIPSVTYIEKGGITFTISTDISFVDNPFDGVGVDDTFPFDYKNVRVKINWRNAVTGNIEEIAMSTFIVPEGLEGLDEDKGGIYISVFNASGGPVSEAEISVTSLSLGYNIPLLKTDNNGNLWLPNLMPASDYHIVVSKRGYSSAQTYIVDEDVLSADYNPIPEKTDINVIANKVVKTGFEIDKLGVMHLDTVQFSNPENVVVNSALVGDRENVKLALHDNQLFVAWEDKTVDNKIYLQKFVYNVASGEYLKSWPSDILLKSGTLVDQIGLEVTVGGQMFLVWSDDQSGDRDIYLQRINIVNGTLVGAALRVNQSSLSLQQNPVITSDIEGNLYVTWEDNRSGDWDLYMQKFQSSSASFWTEDLKVNSLDYAEQLAPFVITDKDVVSGAAQNNVYVFWHSNVGGDFDIYAKKFTKEGVAVWDDRRINSGSGLLDQQNPKVAFDGNEYFYITWTDYRNSQPDIYMQKMDKNNVLYWANDTKINDDAFAVARRVSPVVSYGADSSIYVAWEDSRNGDAYMNIYTTKIDNFGNRKWDYDLMLSEHLDNMQAGVDLVVDTRGKAIAVWSEQRDVNRKAILTTFSELGNVKKSGVPVKIFSSKVKGKYPNPTVGGVPEFFPLYKYQYTATSDVNGQILLNNLEWGHYFFQVEAPYSIHSVDLPSPIFVPAGGEARVVINVKT